MQSQNAVTALTAFLLGATPSPLHDSNFMNTRCESDTYCANVIMVQRPMTMTIFKVSGSRRNFNCSHFIMVTVLLILHIATAHEHKAGVCFWRLFFTFEFCCSLVWATCCCLAGSSVVSADSLCLYLVVHRCHGYLRKKACKILSASVAFFGKIAAFHLHPCISLGLNALETWQNAVSEFASLARYASAWVVVNVVIHKHVKMCVHVCKCDCVSLPVCWLATSLSFITMTYRLSVFHKSFSWKWSPLFFFSFFFFCWFGGDVETGAPLFSAEWSINMTNHEFKDSHCKRFLSVPKSQQGNSSPLSPANTQGLDSRRPCTRLLRSCGICRLPFELFARVFLRPKCVCQAQHMIIVHQ